MTKGIQSEIKAESILFFLFLASLVWAPLPFASARVWGVGLLAVIIGSILCLWLLLALLNRASLSTTIWQAGCGPLVLLLLVQAWILLQTVPLPPGVVAALSPQAYAWQVVEGWRPISLDPYATRHHLLEGLTLCGGFFLCLALVNSQRRVVLLLQVLVFSGTFQAVYGAFMVLSGLEYGFLVEKYSGRGVATGTFVNRNHLAGYLNMCLAAGIGLLLSQLATRSPRNWRERARAWLQLLLSPKMRLRIYIAIMVVTLVLTRARMGNIAFFTALAVAGLIALYASRQIGSSYNFNWRLAIFLASLFLVDMLILGKWFGFDELLERLSQTNAPQEARVQSSAYAADYLQAFPLTGSGAGSFYGVFQNFQQPDLRGLYLHAHNDYLEFAVELGVPAAVLLGAILPWAGFTAYQLQRRENPLARGVGFAVTMTLVWVTMHSATDFNLQIAANSLTFLTLLALTFCCRGLAVK